MFAFFKNMYDLCPCLPYRPISAGAQSPRYQHIDNNLLRSVVSVRLDSIVPKARYGKQDLGFFVIYSVMLTTEKAGNSLPQTCPELEQFIKAQAHIRAAARIIDDISVLKLPQQPKKQQDSFRNLAADVRSTLWEIDSDVQDLLSAYYFPLFPIDTLKEQDNGSVSEEILRG